MNRFTLSFLILLSSIGVQAQITQIREIKPFTRLEVSGAASVIFTPSDSFKLRVVADKEEINNIYTTVEEGMLTIKGKGSFRNSYKIYVTGPVLNQITSSAASKVTISDTLKADSLSIDASGASSVSANVKARFVNVIASGASVVSLSGVSQNVQATVSGASALKAYGLISPSTDVTVSGASSAKVHASQRINANATGASNIKFKGDPKDVSAEASSSSSITKVVDENATGKSRSPGDSTTINFRKKKFVIINRDFDMDTHRSRDDDFHNWAGLGIGFNGWLSDGSFALPKSQEYMTLDYGRSINFQFNPFEKDIHIYKNYVNLVVGLGFEWNRYEFSNRTTLNPDSSYTSGTIDTKGSYRRNSLKSSFINIPVLLEFNTNKNPHKAFHIAVGVIGGYKMGSRTRQVMEINARNVKTVRKDSYYLNPIRINAHASIGYSNLTLYAAYALNPLFENGKGPELYPFTVGIKLVSW